MSDNDHSARQQSGANQTDDRKDGKAGDGTGGEPPDGRQSKGKERPDDGGKSDKDEQPDGGGETDKDEKPDQKKDQSPAPKAKWPWIVGATVVLLFTAVVLFVVLAPHAVVKTNDAYVMAHYTTLAPRVSGQVVAVTVQDSQPVRAGQLLVQIDPEPFRMALDQALGTLEQNKAQVARADAQVVRQAAVIEQAEAQVEKADAAIILSKPNAARYARLSSIGGASEQVQQQTLSQLREDQANRRQAVATRAAAVSQLESLRADLASARALVSADEANVAIARLNLDYTRIVAPIDGTVDQKSVQVGNYATPGAALMTIVPLDAVYIEANYRELELRHMMPGQHVRIHLDAYDVWLDGFVESIPPASGAAYSPIPPNNATGNFTKIVQRLPIKISTNPNEPLARLLRVGMSVETWVDTGFYDVVGAQAVAAGRVTSAVSQSAGSAPAARP